MFIVKVEENRISLYKVLPGSLRLPFMLVVTRGSALGHSPVQEKALQACVLRVKAQVLD